MNPVSDPNGGPPARADALLRRLLPMGAAGDTIIGDLHQEYGTRLRSRGIRSSHAWYWREALGIALHYGATAIGKRLREQSTTTGGRGDGFVQTVMNDINIGFRMLAKTPMLSGVAILTIAIGVGLTTQTFSTVYGTVIRGLPVPAADRLMGVVQDMPTRSSFGGSLSVHDLLDLQRAQGSFEEVAGYYDGTLNIAGEEASPERYEGAFVTSNALSSLGVPPQLGRVFREGEDAPDSPSTIVLANHVWESRFGSDPAVIGSTIRVNGETAEVIGVMPAGFRFPFDQDAWVPHRIDVANTARGFGPSLAAFGRILEGATLGAVNAELATLGAGLSQEFPETNEGVLFRAQPFEDTYMPPEITAVLWLMLGAVFGVLIIACANVANLLLARATTRTREVAIRTALGASRWRVMRQLLAEAFVLSAIGGVLGIALSHYGTTLFNSAIVDIEKPYWIDIRTDGVALTFALAVTIVSSLIAGTLPAIRASGEDVGEVLKDEGRGSSSFRMSRLSSALVVGELAVSCSLLVAAGLMVKSVINQQSLDLGFDADRVLAGRVGLFESEYPGEEERVQFFETLQQRLAGEPGILDVSIASVVPGTGAQRWVFSVDGESYATDADYPTTNGAAIGTGFFDVMGTALKSGRDFTVDEVRPGGEPVIIVNESFVQRFFPQGDVLGERIQLGRDGTGPWMRIVGVVSDLNIGGEVGGIGNDRLRPEQIYIPWITFPLRFMTAVVRTQGPPSAMTATLRRVVSDLDPNLPVYALGALDEQIERSTWAFTLFGSLFSIFGVIALFMSAVGLYGVMAFSVQQRRQEMGVRMALGAGPAAILRLALRRGTRQLALGTAIGLGLGFLLSQPLSILFFDVNPADPMVYGLITVTLALAGLLACYLPARSASSVDPVQAMQP